MEALVVMVMSMVCYQSSLGDQAVVIPFGYDVEFWVGGKE
jgi:hypothetical protein